MVEAIETSRCFSLLHTSTPQSYSGMLLKYVSVCAFVVPILAYAFDTVTAQ